jgi:hypothetical protein
MIGGSSGPAHAVPRAVPSGGKSVMDPLPAVIIEVAHVGHGPACITLKACRSSRRILTSSCRTSHR